MPNTLMKRFLGSFSDNLKSKIQNLKLVGIFAIVVALAVCGARAEAQQPNKIYRIGVLTNVPRSSRIEAFRQGMKELGNVEGKHFTLEIRRAEEKPDQYPKLAAELVGLPVDVIVADSTALTNAAKNATKTIPIVMQAGNPVAGGARCQSCASRREHHGTNEYEWRAGRKEPRTAQGGCPQGFPRCGSDAGRRKQ